MNASSNNVVRLFPESANLNQPGILFASLSERLSISDYIGGHAPHIGQAKDSTERGYLQALDPDPWA